MGMVGHVAALCDLMGDMREEGEYCCTVLGRGIGMGSKSRAATCWCCTQERCLSQHRVAEDQACHVWLLHGQAMLPVCVRLKTCSAYSPTVRREVTQRARILVHRAQHLAVFVLELQGHRCRWCPTHGGQLVLDIADQHLR